MHICEFQSISSGRYFRRTEHPDRATAEQYAIQALIALGEAEDDARSAAEMASYGCADASAHGYGVRIFEES